MLPSSHLGEINSGIHTIPAYVLTFTLLFSDVVVVSDLNKNFGGSMDFAKQRQGTVDLLSPIHPPHKVCQYPFTCIHLGGQWHYESKVSCSVQDDSTMSSA